MFMVCSSVAKRKGDVKPQGNGVRGDEGTPSLDVRDVENAHSHRQDGSYPDESGIRGFIHNESCTYK
jgi:hypothetical protein